jgi:hypothetical protein
LHSAAPPLATNGAVAGCPSTLAYTELAPQFQAVAADAGAASAPAAPDRRQPPGGKGGVVFSHDPPFSTDVRARTCSPVAQWFRPGRALSELTSSSHPTAGSRPTSERTRTRHGRNQRAGPKPADCPPPVDQTMREAEEHDMNRDRPGLSSRDRTPATDRLARRSGPVHWPAERANQSEV